MGEIKQNLIKFPFNFIYQKYKIETHTIEIRFFQFSYYFLLYLIISYYFFTCIAEGMGIEHSAEECSLEVLCPSSLAGES